MKTVHEKLVYERTCKHSVRFDSPKPPAETDVKSVYVSISAFEDAGGIPKGIEVVITEITEITEIKGRETGGAT